MSHNMLALVSLGTEYQSKQKSYKNNQPSLTYRYSRVHGRR